MEHLVGGVMGTGVGVAIFLAILYVIVKAFKGVFGSTKGKDMACTECGAVGPSKLRTRGSIWIELLLWVCFIVPGLIYSIWRLTTRAPVCGTCSSSHIVPVSSPVGRRIADGLPAR